MLARWLLALGLVCAGATAGAQDLGPEVPDERFAETVSQERTRLLADRERTNAAFNAQEQACKRSFFVNACMKKLAEREREVTAALNKREQVLNEAERQRRVKAALARTAAKQEAQAEREQSDAPAQAAARRAQEIQAREQTRLQREADAQARAAQLQEREREAAQRQQAREEAVRARSAMPALPAPAKPAPDR